MRIYHNQLNSTLQKALAPLWLVFGDEPWQKNDALAQIKQAAQAQGFDELLRFSADDKFDWQQIADEYQSMSLFASRRIIEIEVVSGKVGDAGSKVLLALTEQLHPDTLLLLHGPKLDSASSNRKWFKALSNLGCYLPLYDLEGRSLQQWLNSQVRQLGLTLEPAVGALLLELFEGNLPALAQELEKLRLLFPNQPIRVDDAEKIIIKQAKFNPFQLIDALLNGDLPRCIAVLDQLQQEGNAAGQLIWFLHKEIKQLLSMQQRLAAGEQAAELFKEFRIWDKRKPLYQKALQQISAGNLKIALSRVADVDLISKTSSDFNPYILLADVCISVFHGESTRHLPLSYEFA